MSALQDPPLAVEGTGREEKQSSEQAAPSRAASAGIATPSAERGARDEQGIILPGTGGGGGPSGKALANILCCLCGRSIQPNGANMCGTCLKDQVDVAEDIPKKGLVIIQCRRCLKWLTKNDHWSAFELESAPFLALVLKKIPNLAKQEVVDASWIWTEPHSKRLKVRVTVRKEVLNKVMLQQEAVVEFVVHNRQCNVCNKEFTNQTWKAVVQIRQRAGHKRTMLLLEQRILQADAHRKCISVETVRGGMDVYFGGRQDAAEFVSFLSSVAPIRSRESAKLVSTDNHSNVRNSQHTVAVDVPTLCRDDLVALPKSAGNRLQGSLCVVHRITSVVQFVGPSSGETAEMAPDKYWRTPPEPLLSAASLVEFVVLDCEPVNNYASAGGGSGGGGKKAGAGGPTEKTQLWEAVVALASDVGSEEDTFTVSTHVGSGPRGRALEAGDMVLGYDLRGKIFNEVLLKGLSGELPDVVLVKRAPPPKSAQSKKRRNKLRSLDEAGGGGGMDMKEASSSGPGKKGAGGKKNSHGAESDEREISALLEELSMDDDFRAELDAEADPDEVLSPEAQEDSDSVEGVVNSGDGVA